MQLVSSGVGGLGGDINPDLAQSIRDKGWALTDPEYNDLYWNELAGYKGVYDEKATSRTECVRSCARLRLRGSVRCGRAAEHCPHDGR
jgi:hypothetical protein